MGFLKSRKVQILSLVLIVQVALFYGLSRREVVPVNRPLAQVPAQFGAWRLSNEGVIEKEVQDVLKADELLTRTYSSASNVLPAHLFVAYFRSQRTGQTPHSPKNCLPGSGWIPSIADTLPITIPGRADAIIINRYLVSKGDSKSVVLYWYQSRDRVVANEYKAKYYVVSDALRHNRTDTALIRVVVPVVENRVDQATETAVQFVQSFFNPLRQHFPA